MNALNIKKGSSSHSAYELRDPNAEGIESLEHHIFLRASGCHHLQGFYFARPMPPEDITRLAQKQIGMIRPYPRMWA